jgi:hypothetical protein
MVAGIFLSQYTHRVVLLAISSQGRGEKAEVGTGFRKRKG